MIMTYGEVGRLNDDSWRSVENLKNAWIQELF